MTHLFAAQALMDTGWERDVRIVIRDGRIASVTPGATTEPGDATAGIVIPGLANVHSHAFQRVMAGHTENRRPADKDNFWSWRVRMYELAGQIDAAAMQVIARQAYREMLASGFTSVAEFHYLHNEPGSDTPSESMFEAIASAADDAGIRLTYVPVLYERAGFRESNPTTVQRRFTRSVDELIAHYEKCASQAVGRLQTGIGVHSLRAASEASLSAIAAVAKDRAVPMHLHIAEQQREVAECEAALGKRPVEWLFDRFDVDEHWCLVHATHINADEMSAIARSGAVVGLCPSTEANLGDGIFPLKAFLEQGGEIAIGSDSHVSINPFEELRWLEYAQRLITRSRNIAAITRPQTGRSLFEMALSGGARACGRATDRLTVGAHADLVVLDDDSPMLAGHTTESFLDALVFSGFTLPIDRVMVDGNWRVVDGRQAGEEETRREYAAVANELRLPEIAS